MISKGGQQSCKGATGVPLGKNLKLGLNVLELMVKWQKIKKVLGVFDVSFGTYTRRYGKIKKV